MKTSPYIFISYSTKNQDMAELIRKEFDKNGISYWMAPYDIPPGSSYPKEINIALENCVGFVLLLSPDSQKSNYVQKELERAVSYGKTVFPVLIEETPLSDAFKFFISDCQFSDMRDTSVIESNLSVLIRTLKSLCSVDPHGAQSEHEPEDGKAATVSFAPSVTAIIQELLNATVEIKLAVETKDRDALTAAIAKASEQLKQLMTSTAQMKYSDEETYESANEINNRFKLVFDTHLKEEGLDRLLDNSKAREKAVISLSVLTDRLLLEAAPDKRARKTFLKDVKSLKKDYELLPSSLSQRLYLPLYLTLALFVGYIACWITLSNNGFIAFDGLHKVLSVLLLIVEAFSVFFFFSLPMVSLTNLSDMKLYSKDKSREQMCEEIKEIYKNDLEKAKNAVPSTVVKSLIYCGVLAALSVILICTAIC